MFGNALLCVCDRRKRERECLSLSCGDIRCVCVIEIVKENACVACVGGSLVCL